MVHYSVGEEWKHLLERTRKVINEYPRAFWIYNVIDSLPARRVHALPILRAHLTQKYDWHVHSGVIFGVFSVTGMIGSALGGRSQTVWAQSGDHHQYGPVVA